MASPVLSKWNCPIYDWEILVHYFQVKEEFPCRGTQSGLNIQDVQRLKELNPKLFDQLMEEFRKFNHRTCFQLVRPNGMDQFREFFEYYKSLGGMNIGYSFDNALKTVVKAKSLPIRFDLQVTDSGKKDVSDVSLLMSSDRKLSHEEEEILRKGLVEFFNKKGVKLPNVFLKFTLERPDHPVAGLIHGYRILFENKNCGPSIP